MEQLWKFRGQNEKERHNIVYVIFNLSNRKSDRISYSCRVREKHSRIDDTSLPNFRRKLSRGELCVVGLAAAKLSFRLPAMLESENNGVSVLRRHANGYKYTQCMKLTLGY